LYPRYYIDFTLLSLESIVLSTHLSLSRPFVNITFLSRPAHPREQGDEKAAEGGWVGGEDYKREAGWEKEIKEIKRSGVGKVKQKIIKGEGGGDS
jgi:hypothetical protein